MIIISAGGKPHRNGRKLYRNGGSYHRNDGKPHRNGGSYYRNDGIYNISIAMYRPENT
ncbi:MAG: hypothetical protein M0R21_12080 [Lentimicrobiaceae bacterium]|jgi:hypothetical protein|nr:hypothetical protein [Lentimicrobiaceae bacterium]